MMQFNRHTTNLVFFGIFILATGIAAGLKNFITMKTVVFDWKYSFFVQNPENISYSSICETKTSRELNVIFAKILKPTFILENNNNICYLSEKCEIITNVCKNQDYKLIKIQCDENLSIVPDIYNSLKMLNLVSIKLVDNRRWQVVILKDEQTITIDFPSGTPDGKEFIKLDEKYGLTAKYKHIDLRFKSKIGILENNS